MPNILNKITSFLKEAKVELSKVVWPKRSEIIRHTWIVIGVSLGVALFLGIIDYILLIGLEQFFS